MREFEVGDKVFWTGMDSQDKHIEKVVGKDAKTNWRGKRTIRYTLQNRWGEIHQKSYLPLKPLEKWLDPESLIETLKIADPAELKQIAELLKTYMKEETHE